MKLRGQKGAEKNHGLENPAESYGCEVLEVSDPCILTNYTPSACKARQGFRVYGLGFRRSHSDNPGEAYGSESAKVRHY